MHKKDRVLRTGYGKSVMRVCLDTVPLWWKCIVGLTNQFLTW